MPYSPTYNIVGTAFLTNVADGSAVTVDFNQDVPVDSLLTISVGGWGGNRPEFFTEITSFSDTQGNTYGGPFEATWVNAWNAPGAELCWQPAYVANPLTTADHLTIQLEGGTGPWPVMNIVIAAWSPGVYESYVATPNQWLDTFNWNASTPFNTFSAPPPNAFQLAIAVSTDVVTGDSTWTDMWAPGFNSADTNYLLAQYKIADGSYQSWAPTGSGAYSSAFAGIYVPYTGGTPTITQVASYQASNVGNVTVDIPFTGNVPAGSNLIVIVAGSFGGNDNPAYNSVGFSLADTQSNNYYDWGGGGNPDAPGSAGNHTVGTSYWIQVAGDGSGLAPTVNPLTTSDHLIFEIASQFNPWPELWVEAFTVSGTMDWNNWSYAPSLNDGGPSNIAYNGYLPALNSLLVGWVTSLEAITPDTGGNWTTFYNPGLVNGYYTLGQYHVTASEDNGGIEWNPTNSSLVANDGNSILVIECFAAAGAPPTNVSYTFTSTSTPGSFPITNYNWLIDSSPHSGNPLTVDLVSTDTYDVQLTVEDQAGNTGTSYQTVTVP